MGPVARRNSPPPPSKTYVCPLCNKLRMVRPHDYEVSDEMREIRTPRGEKLIIPQDICVWCEKKIVDKHFKPKKADVKKVLKSLEEGDQIDPDKSLEDML